MKRKPLRIFYGVLSLGTITAILLLVGVFYTVRAVRFYNANRSYYEGDSFIQEDALIGYAQRPNITMRYTIPPEYTVFTDSRGTRVDRTGVESPQDVDILAVGDSFTWGHGVQDEETFIKIIGKTMHLTILNAALASYGTTAALRSIQKFQDTKPEIVIYGFITDHLRRAISPCAPCTSPFCRPVVFVDFDQFGKPFMHEPIPIADAYFQYIQEIVLDHPFGLRDIVWAMRRDVIALTGKDAEYKQIGLVRARQPELRRVAIDYLIDNMVETCEQIGARLIIVYIPRPAHIQPAPEELLLALERHLTQQRVEYVDLTPGFTHHVQIYGETSLMAGGIDGHPGADAHRLIAEALFPTLQRLYPDLQ